jgi:hypothetical protein
MTPKYVFDREGSPLAGSATTLPDIHIRFTPDASQAQHDA